MNNFLSKNIFFRNNLLMVIGTNVYSFSQFIYHFLAGRFLDKALYGDLVAIISLMGFVSIIQAALGLTIVNKIASNKNEDDLTNFIRWVNYWSLWIGIILAILTAVLGPIFIKFTNLTQPSLYYFLSPIILGVVVVGFGRSVLQGLMLFNKYVYSLFIEALAKIILTIILILLGLAAFGALTGFLLGIISSYLMNQYLLSSYFKFPKGQRPDVLPLLKYSSATLLQGVSLTSMYSADLVLVKHFFNASDAGLYAAIAILGRIVFFSPTPIINVMFPETTKRHSKGLPTGKILLFSLLVVVSLASLITIIYFILPSVPILVLYGAKYLPGARMLGWYGIFMTLLAVSMLLTQYYLSIKKVRIMWLFILAALAQIILINFYHNSLLNVIQSSIIITALLDFALLVYFFYQQRKYD